MEGVKFLNLFSRRKVDDIIVNEGCQLEWMARDRVSLSTRGVNEVRSLVLKCLESKN